MVAGRDGTYMASAGRPTVVEGLEASEVTDGMVVYDPRRDRVHYLNPVAATVFTFCDGTRERDVIVKTVASLFAAGGASASDVASCVQQLEDEGVLQPPA